MTVADALSFLADAKFYQDQLDLYETLYNLVIEQGYSVEDANFAVQIAREVAQQ